MEEEIQRLATAIRDFETVSQSAAAMIVEFAQAARDRADDPEQVRALADAAERSVSTLVEAMKSKTPAASEPVVTENPVTGAPVEPPAEVAEPPAPAAPTEG